MMRSISPLSFAPSSPHITPSSPLSFADSLPPHNSHDADMPDDDKADILPTSEPRAAEPVEPEPASTPEVKHDPEETDENLISPLVVPRSATPPPEPPLSAVALESNNSDGQVVDGAAPASIPSHLASTAPVEERPNPAEPDDAGAMDTGEELSVLQPGGVVGDNSAVGITAAGEMDVEIENLVVVTEAKAKGESPARDVEVGALKSRDENSVVDLRGEGSSTSKPGAAKEKRKKKEDEQREGPARKKSRVLSEDPGNGSAKGSGAEKQRKWHKEGKRRLEEEDEDEEEEENKHVAPAPKTKKQKKADSEAPPRRSRQSSATASSTSRSKSPASSSSSASSSSKHPPSDERKPRAKPPPKDPETQALDAEICGMLIECMATSRASSLPASTLYKSVMECRPALKAQRSEKEWIAIFERVLHEGEASRGGSGVFGKVESSFKDESDRPLEAQWFYVPEMDEDQERAALIRSMMPRPGKRSETKKYKQYYYRPLAKISRWDPEDEI
ncbi:hypothetical protein LshimejAT787_1901170 [Lyophyllum shimeji]|uniref:Uncharacterized protein n=1 Tax=Lyophyllum shimeji TaxID=47721 RepID=A0A9P3URG1_LYOSH|nr:hypothetical protein LshimejAT787_1901170 [Lyophyllum shimeji]